MNKTNLSQTSWGSRADGDTNDSHRMSPRARRSESITTPPASHPGLIRYNDDKTNTFPSEKITDSDTPTESDLDVASDDSYDINDSHDTSTANSVVMEPHGR